MYTLPVGLASMTSTGQSGDFAAASLLVSLPVVILFIVFRGSSSRDYQQEESRGDSMVSVRYEKVTKRYDDGTEAVKELDLEVADGEFVLLDHPVVANQLH